MGTCSVLETEVVNEALVDHRCGDLEENASCEDNEGCIGSVTVKVKEHGDESNTEKN